MTRYVAPFGLKGAPIGIPGRQPVELPPRGGQWADDLTNGIKDAAKPRPLNPNDLDPSLEEGLKPYIQPPAGLKKPASSPNAKQISLFVAASAAILGAEKLISTYGAVFLNYGAQYGSQVLSVGARVLVTGGRAALGVAQIGSMAIFSILSLSPTLQQYGQNSGGNEA